MWDLAAKAKGVPLHRLIGEARRTRIPAYASLLRIGNPDLVARECEAALRLGYKAIKLHETTTPAVFAARQAIGPGIPLMVDMNCPLNGEAAIAFDPLSSMGIMKALRSAVDAAAAILRHLAGERDAFAGYAQAIAADYTRYLDTRTRYYAMEQRWPDAPFICCSRCCACCSRSSARSFCAIDSPEFPRAAA